MWRSRPGCPRAQDQTTAGDVGYRSGDQRGTNNKAPLVLGESPADYDHDHIYSVHVCVRETVCCVCVYKTDVMTDFELVDLRETE